LKSCLGLINYLGKFSKELANVLQPLNSLLKKDVEWIWGPDQEQAFTKAKEIITSAPTLCYYDPRKPTIVLADSSSYGIGAFLYQQDKGGDVKPVAFAS
jgi:hypothetical protein